MLSPDSPIPDPCSYAAGLTLLHPTRGALPFALYPYQRALLECPSPQRLVVKARQVGVSQVIALEALHRARFHPGAGCLFVSRNREAARHLQQLVYGLLPGDPGAEVERRSDDLLVLANGSTIRSLPAARNTGRTYTASAAYLDEFAHAQHAQAIYQGVAPTAGHGGTLTVVSTPHGKANLFYRLYYQALVGLNSFTIHRIHWSDCPLYNPEGFAEPDPDRRQQIGEQGEWFRANRGRFADTEWAQEYECDFTHSAGLVYREFDPEVHVVDYQPHPDWPTYAGQDFGYSSPAVCLLAQVSPSEHVFVFAEHYQAGRAITTLAEQVYAPLHARHQAETWYCDPSEPGAIHALREAGLPAVPARPQVERGILQVRKLLSPPGGAPPRLYLSRSCPQLAADLVTYSYQEGSEKPEKTGADHGPDALRYLVMGILGGRAETEFIPWH